LPNPVLFVEEVEFLFHQEWKDSDIQTFVKELRKNTKPMIIAANKADLCTDLSIIDKISDCVIPCSAETELLLRKASKAGIVNYSSGDTGFSIPDGKEIPPPQQKALDLVKSVFSKIQSTGIQKILNTAVFDSLKFIVVYPVEDETKLTNKDGVVLPDTKLLPLDSTAKDLASLIHADIAKGFLHAIDCKTKQRISGDQKLKNGDVIKIVSTLSRG
ncbi:MAG: TGS domain-containing protein, partial [Nitrosopumilus sp.]|nr:TGS domain-containing protein [Nitrosopumilus sp.]NNL52913.1 TGS domain-containing protein [Nitrosopumilus sp.]